MGWISHGAAGHEGWFALVLADGRVVAASTTGGVIVHELTGDDVIAGRQVRRYPNTDHVDVVIPWDQVATWRVSCECGWTGAERPAVTEATHGTRERPEAAEKRAFRAEWTEHVAPFTALTDLTQLLTQLHDVETRIEHTVRLARAGGASWTQVGRTAGLSRQGAQQRWGQL